VALWGVRQICALLTPFKRVSLVPRFSWMMTIIHDSKRNSLQHSRVHATKRVAPPLSGTGSNSTAGVIDGPGSAFGRLSWFVAGVTASTPDYFVYYRTRHAEQCSGVESPKVHRNVANS
jgi:hypothetical protein